MDVTHLTNRSAGRDMIQQTVNWVLKLPVQDEKYTSHMRQSTNPLRTHPPSSNASKDFHRLSLFIGRFMAEHGSSSHYKADTKTLKSALTIT